MGTKNRYYGELVLGVVAKSKLELEEFQNAFDEDGLRAELVLQLLDGTKSVSEVLEIYSTKWESF
ncbi:hypothetical protein CIL05_07220 [Virgibacillus profundi]|uniref:Uncharacterized protein n=1 Tax=Virgibacillus profundi TaxID=2024555 RepID=A0A2A2IE18_9BACI|nr:hypothetical protein [Virgibacillus profundi]PAV30251.1 hypothetical protein CIL05_07220 [Virgibacillus profundi]PXY54423.1 hypothetical protein CIT14_07305 [Virgibacillus profundi]